MHAGGADGAGLRDASMLIQMAAPPEGPLANQSQFADEWLDDPRFPSWSSYSHVISKAHGTDFLANPGSRVLVFPEKKLAFCYIEKNACTQFNVLFNRLNNRGGKTWWQSNVDAFSLDIANITRAQGWKWAIFLRNPLMRYLSSWGSKCWQKEDRGANCVGKTTVHASVADFRSHVSANVANPGPMAANPHWAPQQVFCGGLLDAADYDFVGHLRGDVNEQVHEMLRMAGAPEDAVEACFPKVGVHGHHSSLDPKVYYADAATEDGVRGLFRPDYSLPGL